MTSATRSDGAPITLARLAMLLGGLAMFGPFSIDTIFPAFRAIGGQFGADKLAMQQTISVYLVAYAVTSVVHGPLSDAIGRRKVILYAGLLIAGTTLSLGRYLLIGIPILIELVTQAAEELVSGYRAHDATSIFDGGVALLVVVGMQAVFVAAFVQGHHRGLASVFATVTKNLIRHQPSHPDSALPDAPPVVAP